MKIAILGGGMVGICFGKALQAEGHEIVQVCDQAPSEALKQWATAEGISIATEVGSGLADAEVVISAVFGSVAEQVASQAVKHMSKSSMYFDMTTATPVDKQAAAEAAEAAGVSYVDIAITGAVNLGKEKTPLLISGVDAAVAYRLFAPFGGRVQVVGDEVGMAAQLKLMRSVLTKSLEAISVECLVLANRFGMTEEFFGVLADLDAIPIRTLMESMVSTHIEHSGRRSVEVAEALNQMTSIGMPSRVLPGVLESFKATSRDFEAEGYSGKDVKQAVTWLSKSY